MSHLLALFFVDLPGSVNQIRGRDHAVVGGHIEEEKVLNER
jgi:hypothetical protein